MRRHLLLGPLLAVALAACGTTVPLAQQTSATGSADGSLPVDVPRSLEDPAAPATSPGSRATTSAGPASAPLTTRNPLGEPPSDAAGPRAAAGAVPGVTDTTILVGAVVLKNGDKFANGLGFSISFGDAETEFKAVIADVNARGGVAGRKLVPVFAYYDLGGAAIDPESQQSALCSTFTQDHHVFAVFMPYNPLPSFLRCLANRKTLVLNGSAASTDDVGLQALAGWYFAPSMTSYSRYPRTLLRELAGHDFFSGGPAKAGILHIETPAMDRAARLAMKPAIEAAGVPVALVAKVSTTNSNADINGAVLQFKAAGVTHVFFVQAAGGLPLYFMQGADQQQYFPRYALSSFEVPGFFLEGNAPATQLSNAYGIGWEPFFDLKASQLPTRPAEQRCFDVVRKGGENNAHRQSNLTVTPVCDMVWVFAAAAARAGRGLDAPAWRAGLRALGGSFDSPVALHPDFSSGRPDGAAGYRWVAFDAGCSCFRYSGPQREGWL